MAQTFYPVYDRKQRQVLAKTLVDAAGNDVVDPKTGQPVVVPRNYDIDAAIAYGHSLRHIPVEPLSENEFIARRMKIYETLKEAFRDSGLQDLQRTYNNVVGGGGDEYVGAFTPAASFHLGVVGKAAGLTRDEIVAAAGWYNRGRSKINPRIDTSGEFFNNPENVRWIDEGIKAYDSGRLFKRTPMNDQGDGSSQFAAAQSSVAAAAPSDD